MQTGKQAQIVLDLFFFIWNEQAQICSNLIASKPIVRQSSQLDVCDESDQITSTMYWLQVRIAYNIYLFAV